MDDFREIRRQKVAAETEGLPAQPGTPETDADPRNPNAMLLGSNIQPSMIAIGAGEIQLGTVVANAHASSGLTVDEWNALKDETREELLYQAIVTMRRDAGFDAGNSRFPPKPPE